MRLRRPPRPHVARHNRGVRIDRRFLYLRAALRDHKPVYRELFRFVMQGHVKPVGQQGLNHLRHFGAVGSGSSVINFTTDNPFYEKGSERQTLIKLHDCGDCNAEVYFDGVHVPVAGARVHRVAGAGLSKNETELLKKSSREAEIVSRPTSECAVSPFDTPSWSD